MAIRQRKPPQDPRREARALFGAKLLDELLKKYRADKPPRVDRPKLLHGGPTEPKAKRPKRKKMAAK